jgi:GNAT superfamily N-acetyltransferase
MLADLVDRAWAQALGCDVRLVHRPGVHVVPGGERLQGLAGVYMARLGEAALVYCPPWVRERAETVLAGLSPAEAFRADTCARLAGAVTSQVHGPSWHGFVDPAHLVTPVEGRGRRLAVDHPLLTELRHACGDDDWAEGGFFFGEDLEDEAAIVYGIEERGRLVAAGNLTPFLSRPADVGLVTRPEERGRGLATSLTVRMVTDVLPHVGIVRYRALITNAASLRIAASLGFQERGRSYVVHVRG